MAPRFPALKLIKLGAGVTITLVAAVATASWSLRRGTAVYRRQDLPRIPAADVALVPGCHVDGDIPAPMLAARLDGALALYEGGRVSRILVSGNSGAGEPQAMTHWLVARGVPSHDIIADGEGTRTLESMRRAARVFGVTSAVVCTQPLHLARALFLAHAAGIDAVGLEADLDAGSSPRWQAIEALKRTLAVAEVYMLGRLHQDPGRAVAASGELE